ncbi:MAG TPA: hypothetical protein VMB49_15690, partial [Acidobacteriaceae bacterium]|nr:hypothetical protein [Acidobacteriaceae bacterium]
FLLQRDPEALDILASVLEPVDFHERSKLQHTNGWTGLDRLVDAVVPDPPSRQQFAGEVDAIAGRVTLPPAADPKKAVDVSGDVPQGAAPSPEVAYRRLRERFLSWQSAQTHLMEEVQRTPRLSDTSARAQQLGELASVGLSALAYLQSHTAPPAGWQTQQIAIIDAASEPAALVRFTVLYSMRKLVLAAAQEGTAP